MPDEDLREQSAPTEKPQAEIDQHIWAGEVQHTPWLCSFFESNLEESAMSVVNDLLSAAKKPAEEPLRLHDYPVIAT